MKIRLASNLQQDSIVDGEGIRTVIWVQGCAHACPGCHNPMTHDFKGGFLVDTLEIEDEIRNLKGQTGITLSGGDPIYQIEPVTRLAKVAQESGLNVWLYTGFTYEEIIKMPTSKNLLKYVDVLVDGPFILSKRSLDMPFRGSTNQRIIDVPKTLKNGEIELIDKYINKKDVSPLYKKDTKLFV